jgi:acetyltransferase-like isoleucine patch superfamily enzyme
LLNEKLILTPAFKTRLNTYGTGLRVCKMPFVENDNLIINVGDNVTFIGNNDFSGGKVYDNPVITIGSNINIGYGSTMSCAQSITIGNNCKIAANVYIADNDGHPINPERRNGDITQAEVKPVTIESNVWLCTGCTILKGSTIGTNSVIGAHAVVSGVVPPNSIAVGNPAIIMPCK